MIDFSASLRDRATLASPQAPAGLGHPESIPSADFTAEDFLAWARTMPPEKEYDYADIKGCAVCHYLHDRGLGFRGVGDSYWRDLCSEERPIPERVRACLQGRPRTYAGLAERIVQSTGETK